MQVTGDSIFNLLALADIETDKDDRPVYPQKILSVEVVFCSLVFGALPLCFGTYNLMIWYLLKTIYGEANLFNG